MNDSSNELASLYMLDQLDAGERAAFEARLLREPELSTVIRALEAGLACGIHALTPREPPTALLDRIEQQLDALPGQGPGWKPHPISRSRNQPAAPRRRTRTVWAGWGIAAIITLSLATLAVQSIRRPSTQPVFVLIGMDANRNTFTKLPQSGASPQDADARFIQLASLAENFLKYPNAAPIPTTSTPGENRGYALFDPGSQQGFIAIEHLPPLTENQRYHLWIITASTDRVRDAGILPTTGLNRSLCSFVLEPTEGTKPEHPNFFITVEENGNARELAEPRGKVVLGNRSF